MKALKECQSIKGGAVSANQILDIIINRRKNLMRQTDVIGLAVSARLLQQAF